jgi:hypothetical protein
MANWGAAVPIIVGIIGISGVVIPAFSTVLINQTYNKPNLNIDIGSPGPVAENSTVIIVEVTNMGTMPATNLSLLLTTAAYCYEYL